jgi:hypothetical protein
VIEADAIVNRYNTALGYPDRARRTETYSIPQEHFTTKGLFLVIIKSVESPSLGRKTTETELDSQLTADERAKKKTEETLDSEGAFEKDRSVDTVPGPRVDL